MVGLLGSTEDNLLNWTCDDRSAGRGRIRRGRAGSNHWARAPNARMQDVQHQPDQGRRGIANHPLGRGQNLGSGVSQRV
jgi:hypothetical protein